jgi:hypothetical protein
MTKFAPLGSPELHQHLSDVLAREQFEEGSWCVLDPLFDGLPPHFFLELGREIEVVGNDEAL